MKWFNWAILAFVLLASFCYAQQDTLKEEYVPGEVLIKTSEALSTSKTDGGALVTGVSWFDALSVKYNITSLSSVFNTTNIRFQNYYKVVFDPSLDVKEAVADFKSQSGVEIAEPNYIFHSSAVPNDALYSNQWALSKIQAPQAWDINTGSSSVIIGIIDSGCDIGFHPADPTDITPHPDLADNLWTDASMNYGYNATDEMEPPYDGFGHGTHVAGIAAASSNNGEGICGLAGGWGATPGVKIMTVKGLRDDGTGYTDQLANAILWAADPDQNSTTNDGARVINMSWGMWAPETGPSPLKAAIDYAYYDCGCVLIAAAGNENMTRTYWEGQWWRPYPSSWNECIAVGATGTEDEKSRYSNYGDWVDVAAPGGNYITTKEEAILSTLPTYEDFYLHTERGVDLDYDHLQGTSMAAPYVTGLAGLILSQYPTLSNVQVRERILGSVDNINHYRTYDDSYIMRDSLGMGRINAYKALSYSSQPVVILNNAIFKTTASTFVRQASAGPNEMVIWLKNIWENAGSVTATIRTEDPNVSLNNATVGYGSISAYETKKNESEPFTFDISAACPYGYKVKFYVDVDADGHTMTDSCEVEVGAAQYAGFPVYLGGSFRGSPNSADIDGDKKNDIVIGSTNGTIYVVRNNGSVNWTYETSGEILSTPAIGDVTGDKVPEVAVISLDGNLYLLNNNGELAFSKSIGEISDWADGDYIVRGPSAIMADVDGNGIRDVVSPTSVPEWGLVAYNGSGDVIWNTATNRYAVYATPACGDINGDGCDDIFALVHESTGYLYAFNGRNGKLMWKVRLDGELEVQDWDHTRGPVICDLNLDGKLEIIASIYVSNISRNIVTVINTEGGVVWQKTFGYGMLYSTPSVIDMNHDGYPEIVCSERYTGDLYVLDKNGNLISIIPADASASATPVSGGFSGNSNVIATTSRNYKAQHINPGTSEIYQMFSNSAIMSTALWDDLDADSRAEIIAGDEKGNLYAWKTNDSVRVEWVSLRHDQYNSGNYHTNRPLSSIDLDATAYNNGKKFLFDGYNLKNHLVYTSSDKVYHVCSYDLATGWDLPIALGDGKYPSIAIDGQGQANIVWTNTTAEGDVQLWANRDNEFNSTLLKDLGIIGFDYSIGCSPPSIAANGDTAYMVYLYSVTAGIPPQVTATKNVVFAKWPVGKYGEYQEEIIDTWEWNPTGPSPRSPSICIDNKGYINLAWEKVSTVEEPGDIWWTVRYSNGSWHHLENLSNSYGIPSIEPSLNTYGNVHLTWEENGEICYRECVYQPTPLTDGSLIPPQQWDPYVWGVSQNISQTPDWQSLQPVFCNNYVSFMEQQPGDDYEVMLYQKDNDLWLPVDGGNVSQNPSQLSCYPHLTFDGSDLLGLWTERNDWGVGLKSFDKAVSNTAVYQASLGNEIASPYTVQRDGYIVYGASKSKSASITTVDYDTTELIYQISDILPKGKYTLDMDIYQENIKGDKWQYTVMVDDNTLQTLWVPSGVPTKLNKLIPASVVMDSIIMIRILKKKGDIVTCDKWQLYYDSKGSSKKVIVADNITDRVFVYAMAQNAPNPFNGQTAINYQLAQPGKVSLKIYNTLGQLVNTLVDGYKQPGSYSAVWNGKDNSGRTASNGVYIYRLESGDFKATKKMVVIK